MTEKPGQGAPAGRPTGERLLRQLELEALFTQFERIHIDFE
jgi:hypothetical protein